MRFPVKLPQFWIYFACKKYLLIGLFFMFTLIRAGVAVQGPLVLYIIHRWKNPNNFILASSVVYQTSVGIANPKQKPTILLCGFESNTLLSKLDCAWDLKGSHTIVCKTFSHTGDHTILSFSPNYFPPLMCFRNRQVTPSIGGKKGKVPWMANR